MILGAMADGTTTVTGLLEGADILSTAVAMQDFGAQIERQKDGSWIVIGCGSAGFQSPAGDVDCGNAGTGVRLIMGCLLYTSPSPRDGLLSRMPSSA